MVNVFISYASGAQIPCISHTFYICFICVKHLGYGYLLLVRLL